MLATYGTRSQDKFLVLPQIEPNVLSEYYEYSFMTSAIPLRISAAIGIKVFFEILRSSASVSFDK